LQLALAAAVVVVLAWLLGQKADALRGPGSSDNCALGVLVAAAFFWLSADARVAVRAALFHF